MTSRTRPWWAVAILVGYLIGMALLVTWPDAHELGRIHLRLREIYIRLGAPASLSSGFWEFVHNVLLCIPPTAAAMVLWRRSRWWQWSLLGLLLSVGVELVQARYLPGRSPQIEDIVANSLGALIGSLLGAWWRARQDRPPAL